MKERDSKQPQESELSRFTKAVDHLLRVKPNDIPPPKATDKPQSRKRKHRGGPRGAN